MITYGITVADEFFEFKRLINSLEPYILPDEEIVILADKNKVTEEIQDFCEYIGLTLKYFDFQNDFAEFKNELFKYATKPFLFQIDADEQIPFSLLNLIRNVAESCQYDLFSVPRINVVRGATEKDIENFNWQINDMGWEGYPDNQFRFMSTQGHIRWHGKVHELPKGCLSAGQARPDPMFSILHVKDIDKQKKQNQLYDKI
tara:strand:- start:1501 stop:2106 length:606 start_codon:yes stop_codon:yes gene_type:complete